jgi:hypothetical protein
MNTSLSKFCKDTNLPKSSVYNRCKELNFDTSNGLTPAMVSQLEHEFGVNAPVEVEESIAPTVTVEVGNHHMVVSPPQMPQTYSLDVLRNSEAMAFDDPLSVAAQYLTAGDGLINAMGQDIAARQERLNQTRQAKDAIAAKKQTLELEARLYQLQTQQLDGALNAETQQLQQQLAALQQLGKPQEAAPTDPA